MERAALSGTAGVRIRKMALRDVQAVLAVQSACQEIAQWSAADYEQVARGDLAGWVAEEDDGIAGFLAAHALGLETEILNLAVQANARRRGLGTALLAEAANWSRALGAKRLMLEVRVSNEAAVKFYKRLGFCAVGRRSRYYSKPIEDALLLDLPL
jgi:[ribosomal protein S18]-alanine N-acetyltransferase